MEDWLISLVFSNELDYKPISDILHQGKSIVLLKNVPLNDDILSSIVSHLGIPITELRNNNNKDVFDVKVFKNQGLFRSIANSNLDFPLHTDCADFKETPNVIGLLCVNPAPKNQGISTFAFVSDIVKKLNFDTITVLLEEKWAFKNYFKPILTQKKEQFRICYDRITMESYTELKEEKVKKLDLLDTIFKKCTLELKLESGDLILFRNDLLLHGRTGFEITSNRLFKRVRFHLN